jgi:arabinose-5-phosphate isomerase
VVLTGKPDSTLAKQCEVVLDVGVAEEACPMNLAPTSSTTATLAMGDALAMALLEARGLRPEDYAALHPGGTLGWRALFRVADLMRTGDEIPIVREDASLKDVVEEMTRTRFGVTTVVDAAGRLIGVFTDGDLRRLHLANAAGPETRARDIAVRGPKLIGAEELAAKALEMMERFQITSLVIVDTAARPVGLIRMHDVLRAKIVY